MDIQRNEYAEMASSINIGDIASSDANAQTLRRLRDNDPQLRKLSLCRRDDQRFMVDDRQGDWEYFWASASEDLGWVGYFVGKNTMLRELSVGLREADNDSLMTFFREASRNRSAQTLSLTCSDLSSGDAIRHMEPFFQNNGMLNAINVAECDFGGEGDRLLALMLEKCPSLKHFDLEWDLDGIERPSGILQALRSHHELAALVLVTMNVGRNECRSLATLPCFSTLDKLVLIDNHIDDEGIEALADALVIDNQLRMLNLSRNQSITTRGFRSLAAMLESPKSKLETLCLLWNNIDDERAQILARGLANNRELKVLGLVMDHYHENCGNQLGIVAEDNIISAQGWSAFSSILCNTSSIDETYNSNHKLRKFSYSWDNLPNIRAEGEGSKVLSSLRSSLEMNRTGERKSREGKWKKGKVAVARRKIIKHHLKDDADMEVFVHMNCAVLPHFIAWVPNDELSVLFLFVRNMHTQLGFTTNAKAVPGIGLHKRQRV